jgi:hypothetical protein
LRLAAATALVVVAAGVGAVVGAVIGSDNGQAPARPGGPSVAFNTPKEPTTPTGPTTGNI